ncbi:MAG: hypothetical protein H6574_23125 [Lewinellaceae bacterium]|nr:hypothetical protein [Lewinellaceae bacterium]
MPTLQALPTIFLLALTISGCTALRNTQTIPTGAGSFTFQQKASTTTAP